MCLNNRLIPNRKYIGNKKNGGIAPVLKDQRAKYVPVGCGVCVECRKQKANEWKVRLFEEIKHNNKWLFVTLTFSEEKLQYVRNELIKDYEVSKNGFVNVNTGEFIDKKYIDKKFGDNAVATYAVRHFLENWRKKTGKSVKHFLITEKGHRNTKRIHLHGLINSLDSELIRDKWLYGWVYIGNYVSNQTINYISKYITKVDDVNKDFTGKILCSAGIGKNYENSGDFKRLRFNGEDTRQYYISATGKKMNLPTYYRNKRYSDEEREELWMIMLNKNERFVCGERVDISTKTGLLEYYNLLEYYRRKNKLMGYKNNKNEQFNDYIDNYSKLINNLIE